MPTIEEIRKRTKVKRRGFLYPIYDFLAVYPAKILLNTPLTPNGLTIFWVVVQIISALFLASGDYLTMVIGLLVFQLMFILDCTDGIIARYKKIFSLNGIYYDYLGHYVANPLLLISLGLGVAKIYSDMIYAIVGGIAALAFLLNKAVTLNPSWYSNDLQRKKIEESMNKSFIKNQNKFVYFVFELFRIEYPLNLMFWGVLFGYAQITLIVYMVLFLMELFRKVFSQIVTNYRLERK